MKVGPAPGGSTLTYSVPRAWLDDPARVYPVILDPTLTKNPDLGNGAYPDTFVGSGAPGSSHGPATNLLVGKDTDGYNRLLIKFNLTSIPANSYVPAATLKLYKFYSGGSTPNIVIGSINPPLTWGGGSTWTSLGFAVNRFDFYDQVVSKSAPTGWFSDNSAATVRAVNDWVLGNKANQGFVLRQKEDGSEGTAYLSKFYSVDYSNSSYWPSLYQVTYNSTVPTAAVSGYQGTYRVGDSVTATWNWSWAWPALVDTVGLV